MHITIASRISTGIRYLLTFSIPFSTPKTTISAVSPKKIKKNTPTIFKKYCGKCVLASYRREEEIIIKHIINNVYLNIDLHAYEYRILYYSTENKEMQLILEHKCSNSTPPFLMAHQASTMVYKLLEENKIPRQPQQGLLF